MGAVAETKSKGGFLSRVRRNRGKNNKANKNETAKTSLEEQEPSESKQEIITDQTSVEESSNSDSVPASKGESTEEYSEPVKKEEMTLDSNPLDDTLDTVEEEEESSQKEMEAQLENEESSKNEVKTPPKDTQNKINRKSKNYAAIHESPPAREAAFSGPPRYDWIDIETAAAVKVQATFRKSRVMKDMEAQGLTTAAMRNRARARNSRDRTAASEDVPDALRFCGLGFLFGDASTEEQEILDAHTKAQYEEKKKQEFLEDEKRRKFRMRRKASETLLESVEVVDEV